jgi:homogentisate 1,2-dioxygenase
MAAIIKRGTIPKTPHTEHYHFEGVLALEEIHGTLGFGGPWSRKMHVRSYPTEQVQEPVQADFSFRTKIPEEAKLLRPYMVQTKSIPNEGNALTGKKVLFKGPDTRVCTLKTQESYPENVFFRNGEKHEIYYFHKGKGSFQSEYGEIKFRPETYLIVPKGTTYRIDVEEELYVLLFESKYLVEWPDSYLNHAGQATMMSPVVETEIELPELLDPIDQRGEFPIFVQHAEGQVTKTVLGHHPFDLCGWEGALYPFLFDINNHHGIAREIHVAPPAHQTFQAGVAPYSGFALCSFVPQPEGWHKKEVPVPYAHYNVDSDEVMFFCNTSYGARKGVLEEGTLTFHPGACPHSPHGDAAKNSLPNRGRMSQRLAVMMDTFFESLQVTETALKYADLGYTTSWDESKTKS